MTRVYENLFEAGGAVQIKTDGEVFNLGIWTYKGLAWYFLHLAVNLHGFFWQFTIGPLHSWEFLNYGSFAPFLSLLTPPDHTQINLM